MAITLGDTPLNRYFPFALIASAWLYLYSSDYMVFNSQWNTDDFSYCYLVPFLATYLLWEKRTKIASIQDNTVWPGFVGILLSGMLLFIGRLGSVDTLIFISAWLSILSIFVSTFGWKSIKHLLFPALILLFIVPPPAFIERTLSFNLRLVSSELSAQLLTVLSVPVFLEGNIIDLGTIKLQVVDACSGLRYLIPTMLLSLIVGYAMNKAFWSRLALLLLSAPISIALNAIRITITGVLVRYISPTLADGFFHDFQGWVIYIAAIALLASCSLVLKRFEAKSTGEILPAEAKEAIPEDKSRLWRRLYSSVIVSFLFVSISFGLSEITTAQSTPAWKSLDTFPLQIGAWTGTRSYIDQLSLEGLGADDYFLASYRNTTTGNVLNLLIPYYRTQSSRHTAHAPTSCMLGSGWEISGRKILRPLAEATRAFPIQQLVLAKSGDRLLSNFWFQQRGRIIVGEYENKAYLFLDAVTKHRTDGALIRVEMAIPRGMTEDQAQTELDPFTVQVAEILRTFLPQ